MDTINRVLSAMVTYYSGDAKRINHFLKVYGFAKLIGAQEGLTAAEQEILEIAALTHDIGIKNSELKYDSSSGSYQQIEGPPVAKAMLEHLGVADPVVERVCWLIAHHHTYNNITDSDYQILVEADFLVNIFEDNMSSEAIKSIDRKIFTTAAGRQLLKALYLPPAG